MKHTLVTEVMSDDVITCKLDTPYTTLEHLMKDCLINHIPIVDDNDYLSGIVSRHDLIKAYVDYLKVKSDNQLPPLFAKDVVNKNVISIRNNADIKQVAEIISAHSFHSVPVVDDANKLLGIVTASDLIDYIIEA